MSSFAANWRHDMKEMLALTVYRRRVALLALITFAALC